MSKVGSISVVGIGPGCLSHLTPAGRSAIESAEVVVGYKLYIQLINELIHNQKIIATGMTREVDRVKAAVRAALAGRKVVIVSSGDAGVYGMAPLVFEVLQTTGTACESLPEVTVIPGITAANFSAALVGAPLAHDTCLISLSDLLTPKELILKRILAAAVGDFVVVLYNPASKKRGSLLNEALKILLEHRSPATPLALVHSAYRAAEKVVITDLEHCLSNEVDMLTTVIIGNSTSYVWNGKIVTPRGYGRKYDLG